MFNSLAINLKYTKSKSFSNNCSKSNSNISNKINNEKLRIEKEFEIKEKFETKDLKGFE